MTILAHIHFRKFSITRVFRILYNQRRGTSLSFKVQQASTPCTHNHWAALSRGARLQL